MKTRFKDLGRPDCESRLYAARTWPATRTGQIRMTLTCPFCDGETVAWLWSLSGGGKRCESPGCGAIFGRPLAYRLRPSEGEINVARPGEMADNSGS